MKLLFVTPTFPYPLHRGYAHITYYHMRHLAAKHQVDLVSFVDKSFEGYGDLDRLCRHIETVSFQPGQAWLRKARAALGRSPLQVSFFHSPAMARLIERRLAKENYDVAVFQVTAMSQYRPDGYKGASILNMIDPLILSNRRLLPISPPLKRHLIRSRIKRLERYELPRLPLFDRVLLLNPSDVEDYQVHFPQVSFDWVPYAVDLRTFSGEEPPGQRSARRSGAIIMSGNMDYFPNAEGAEFFYRRIFPRISAQVSEAQLWLVGGNPTKKLLRLQEDRRVKVTGFVPDVRSYLKQAMISICPVRLNIGTQTKVLEAMACGTPVVSTTAGNHGIAALPGVHLEVADDPEVFADKVVSLLRGENWSVLADNAKSFVASNYTWENSAARFESILEAVLAGRAATAASEIGHD